MTSTSSSLQVLIVGATSGIAEATARLYAAEGAALILVARRGDRLEQIAGDLRLRGATRIETRVLDPANAEGGELSRLAARLGRVDHIIIAYGMMPDQAEAERDPAIVAATFQVNLVSVAVWALAAATLIESQGTGSLVILGSPAGDRGRRRNYIYGASKAGLQVLIEGIAHRFAGKRPRAVLLKPGPTATRMTAALDRSRLASPEIVARAVRRAAEKGGVVQYTPARWWIIMRIVRAIPSLIFNRLDF